MVAAFASWHEGHVAASKALEREPHAPSQVLIESYSVLTRLPPPHRAPADLVASFLEARFPRPPLVLAAHTYKELLREAILKGFAGGAVYDAVVAHTAKEADALLLTRDRRAVPVYELVGIRFELVF